MAFLGDSVARNQMESILISSPIPTSKVSSHSPFLFLQYLFKLIENNNPKHFQIVYDIKLKREKLKVIRN